MDNPFQVIAAAFEADYRVNFRIERMDGSVTLTLSDDTGTKARRLITKEQLHTPKKLDCVIDGIRLGMAIDSGCGVPELLASLSPYKTYSISR